MAEDIHAATGPSDAELIDQAFELAADKCDDITPLVFDAFFERRPDTTEVFQVDDSDRGRGRMLVEVMGLLQDSARGEGYVPPTMATIAADHMSYGVYEPDLYREFLAALGQVLAELLGEAWTTAFADAWERQCQVLLQSLPRATMDASLARSRTTAA